MSDPSLVYLIDFFSGLDLLAPADPVSTRRAWRHLRLAEQSIIVDAGCGTGRQTRQLLEETPAWIVATDLERTLLKPLAHESGTSGRLRVVASDMLALPFPERSLDLIHSEGAIYSVGVKAGLAAWLPLLKPGGHVCVSDAAYTTETPPLAVRQFWESEYPGIGTAERFRERAIDAGYEPIDEFWMPASGWDAYYEPVTRRIADLAEGWASNETATGVLDSLRDEVNLYERYGHTYGYRFLVLQKPAE